MLWKKKRSLKLKEIAFTGIIKNYQVGEYLSVIEERKNVMNMNKITLGNSTTRSDVLVTIYVENLLIPSSK